MTTVRGRSLLALSLAWSLCASAQAADIQGRSPIVTPAQAASITAPRVPALSIPQLGGIPSALPGAGLQSGVALPGVASAGAAQPAAAVPSAAAALLSSPLTPAASILPGENKAPAASLSSVPGDNTGRASTERSLSATEKDLAPELEAAQAGKGDARLTGEEIQRRISGEEGRRGTVAVHVVPSYMGASSRLANRLPNPADLYALAQVRAQEAAAKWGVKKEDVVFGEVTASMPAAAEREMHFAFYAAADDAAKTFKPILVSFKADGLHSPATPWTSTVRTWDAAMTLDRPLFPKLSDAYYFRRGSEATPDVALDEARRALPELGAGVSFTLRMEEEPQTGAVDLWYRFYDNAGNEVAVNSRTGERVVAHAAASRKTIDHVLGRRTSELLGGAASAAAVYPLGSVLAHATGFGPIAGFVLGYLALLALAVLVKLLPLPAFRRWGTVIGAGVIFSPLLAVGVLGAKVLLFGAGALGAAGTLKDSAKPADRPLASSYGFALDAARDAASRARVPAPAFLEARRTPNGWVFDFEAGDRLVIAQPDAQGRMSAYAYGARERGPLGLPLQLSAAVFSIGSKVDEASAVRLGAARLGVPAAQTSLSVIVLEQPRSGDKDLWYVVDDADGRRAGVNARTGEVKDLPNGPARAEVESAARGAASYKGMPWSHTEYSMSLYGYESGLRKAGATQAQLALFRALTDAAPLRGGRFNPWSGD